MAPRLVGPRTNCSPVSLFALRFSRRTSTLAGRSEDSPWIAGRAGGDLRRPVEACQAGPWAGAPLLAGIYHKLVEIDRWSGVGIRADDVALFVDPVVVRAVIHAVDGAGVRIGHVDLAQDRLLATLGD